MPLIPDSHFEQLEKKLLINKKIENKKILNHVAESCKDTRMTDQKMCKELNKNQSVQHFLNAKPVTQQAPPQNIIRLKDLQNEEKVIELVENKKKNEIKQMMKLKEIAGIKNSIINTMAFTQKHPIKRKIFAGRLNESEIVHEYIENNMLYHLFSKANNTIKFACIYGINYIQANTDYENYVLLTQQQKQEKQPEEKKEPEEPKPETKSESESKKSKE